jgi:carboxypeptidase family protein
MRSAVRYVAFAAVMMLIVPIVSSAQFRGLGRVTGTVADDTGAPLRDVLIRATMTGEEGVIEERTDDKGSWAVNGMAKGEWHLTFQTPGYVPVAAKVTLSAELARVNPIAVVLKKVK